MRRSARRGSIETASPVVPANGAMVSRARRYGLETIASIRYSVRKSARRTAWARPRSVSGASGRGPDDSQCLTSSILDIADQATT